MTSALVIPGGGLAAPNLIADLASCGVEVSGETDCPNLLQELFRKPADVVVCFQESPGAVLFDALATVAANAPRPVVLFTLDPDAGKMEAATRSGVHAYVVAGYGRNRLRSVLQLAQARFRHEQVLRGELEDVRRRFDERKLVDRAKGILMGARQLREEEAFRALRTAAMASKQRIGQLSQVVIDSAQYAEAVNRAGQLRMLSQRLVKFYALACTGAKEGEADGEARGMLADCVAQVGSNLSILERSLSRATFSDLLEAVEAPWRALEAALRRPPAAARLREVDALAEQVLEQAETLTANLEIAAYATVLHAINVSGRQRMLTQRMAKEALMATLPGAADAAPGPGGGATFAAFLAGLDYLDRLPLSNEAIRRELAATHRAWALFRAELDGCATAAGRGRVAASSEVLLGHFDRLTDLIERGIHALMGV